MTPAESALREMGIECVVEARDKLAVLISSPQDVALLADGSSRRQILDVLRAYGFSHAAVELRDECASFSPSSSTRD